LFAARLLHLPAIPEGRVRSWPSSWQAPTRAALCRSWWRISGRTAPGG